MPAINGRRDALATITREASTHAGLWLDKYLSVLSPETDEEKRAIRDLLLAACSTSVPEGYFAAFERRKDLLPTLTGGVASGATRVWNAKALGRIVIGLGVQSIRETNVTLLHTWGVPYLPGSALKGLASAAAHRLGGAPSWNKAGKDTPEGADHRALFGDTTQAGWVTFHDAWWVPEVGNLPLDLDVMTVHHADYYRDGETPPADWDEPNPVGFLTTRGTYHVALSGPERWVLSASEWLKAGLDQLGLGAKTQAGYGRMSLSPVLTTQEIEEAAQREKYKARLATLAGFPAQHKGAGTARQHIQKLREAISEGAPAAEVYAIGRALFEKDRKFWHKWAVEDRRTPEEKEFMIESGMLQGQSGETSR